MEQPVLEAEDIMQDQGTQINLVGSYDDYSPLKKPDQPRLKQSHEENKQQRSLPAKSTVFEKHVIKQAYPPQRQSELPKDASLIRSEQDDLGD